MDERTAHMYSLTENLLRVGPSLFEETRGIVDLLALTLEIPAEEVAAYCQTLYTESRKATSPAVGDKRVSEVLQSFSLSLGSFVTHRLPVLRFPPDLLQTLEHGEASLSMARVIVLFPDTDERLALLQRGDRKG